MGEKAMTYYKVLNNGKSPFAIYDYTPYLPKDGKPGKWLPNIDKLELCESGYHVMVSENLIDWLDGNQLYEVEVKGKVLEGDNKITCQQIRLVRQVEGWNEKNLRFFACWCAELALPVWEEKHPGDNRPRKAIETAKRYAEGLATEGELAAAWDAAWAAYRAAYRAASKDMAWDAAWDAPMAAAWAAAWDAPMAAAWAAAWAAAMAAAWAAAWAAARDTARDTASSAACAARAGDRAVARAAQSIKLQEIVFGERK